VLLVDRAHFPRDKACAEYVSPGGADILERLGALGQHGRRLRGMQIRAPGGGCHLIDYCDAAGRPAFGLSIARTELDAALVDVARQRGVEVRQGVRIAGAVREAGVVRGVADAAGHEIAARFVIGADGLHSVVARAGGPTRRLAWPRRLGLVLHMTGVDWPEDVGHMHVGRAAYVGVAPLDSRGLVSVGLVRPLLPRRARQPARQIFDATLAEFPELAQRLRIGQPADQVRGVGPLAHRARRVAGPGYLLVGDAAGFFDPFTGEGIFRALRGAELAATAADAALRGGDPIRVSAAYASARARAFGAKERLTAVIQVFVQVPKLMDLAIARLQERPHVARRLGNMLGDLESSRLAIVPDLLRP
jgi:menaquinone-9 beta-reductase